MGDNRFKNKKLKIYFKAEQRAQNKPDSNWRKKAKPDVKTGHVPFEIETTKCNGIGSIQENEK